MFEEQYTFYQNLPKQVRQNRFKNSSSTLKKLNPKLGSKIFSKIFFKHDCQTDCHKLNCAYEKGERAKTGGSIGDARQRASKDEIVLLAKLKGRSSSDIIACDPAWVFMHIVGVVWGVVQGG